MHIFWHGAGVGINEANPVELIQIVSDLRSQLELKDILGLILLIRIFYIEIQRFGQVIEKHNFLQNVPGYTIILAIRIAVTKNECFQIVILEKTRRAEFFCTSRIYDKTSRDQSLVMVFTS